ncbi:MAG: cytochrome c biogenesis protein CcsA, partial [Clostridia bacterium]|nr:cytochrome c biogenesis protein CcsA [Deltaproteobacteria bacterium]
MHSLVGQALVLLAVLVASFGVIVGFVGGRRQSLRLLRWTETSAYAFAATMFLANLVMVRALLAHDFSVKYVAQVGSLATPTWVTIVSLWSSLEGSILFWGAIMGAYVAAFTFFNRHAYREYMAYALATILFVGGFFALLIAGPANPFTLLNPAPANGPGPNPLLQNHLLMVIHPPSLYLGYVGMTVPFGIAVAALLRGRLSEGWLKPLRRWTMIPWTFLSIGIVLG